MISTRVHPEVMPNDIAAHNRRAWDLMVERGNQWTVPVTSAEIAAARRGNWQILVTLRRAVPLEWFPAIHGTRTLCLAGSGGQQAPILAAAGARVTVFDNSPRQLAQDRLVADRDHLDIQTTLGDMRDLHVFDDGSFELVVHPCSNCFVPDVRVVWKEIARVLAPGGILIAGFINPMAFVFDETAAADGDLRVRHRLPYGDATHLDDDELRAIEERGEPFVFGHSLEAQIGGQLEAGLVVTHLFEDDWPGRTLSMYAPSLIATRAVKSSGPALPADRG
jgi:SAM-dependent methyltransferase